jgi:hypothetical protein
MTTLLPHGSLSANRPHPSSRDASDLSPDAFEFVS